MKLAAPHQSGEHAFASLLRMWRVQERRVERRALDLLERFNLAAMRDQYAATLSGGQRKLLEMARALMTEPKLVMLDEPMAGVNPALGGVACSITSGSCGPKDSRSCSSSTTWMSSWASATGSCAWPKAT